MTQQRAVEGRRRPSVGAPAFVGREDELHLMTRALSEEPALVLVEGEAGIGKSRLIQEALRSPQLAQRQPLVASCPPFRDALTFSPIVDAIRAARTTVEFLQLTPLAGTLRPLFPEWADHLPPSPEPLADAGAARHRLMRALADLLESLGINLLVVEDVHWADDATVDFLLFIASSQAARIALVLSYRPEDLAFGSPLLRLSSRSVPGSGRARIVLRSLGVGETAVMVSSMLDGESVSEDFAAFLHERTDGIPLALEESVWLLRDRADLIRQHGEWVRRTLQDIEVPPTIRDAVAERIARLRPDAQTLLRAAAVLGEPVDEATLTDVSGLPPLRARDAVDDALQGGLLVETDKNRLAFRHVLAARAVYDRIPGRARRTYHRRAGTLLSATRTPAVARLAHHFRESGDTRRWWDYAEEAADLALASGDHQAAATYLHELLIEEGQPGTTVARLTQKMPVFTFTGYIGRADVVSTLRSVLDGETLSAHESAELRAQLGRMLMHAGEYAAGAAELQRAIPDLNLPLAAARAMMVLGRAGGAPWAASVHRQWIDRAAQVTDASIPADERLSLLVDQATGLLEMGDPDGWRVAELLPAKASTPQQTLELVRGTLNMGDAAMSWGRYDDARQLLLSAIDLAQQHRYHRLRDMAQVTLIHLDWHTGRWSTLVDRATAMAKLDSEPVLQLDALLVLGLLEAASGAGAEAEEKLRHVAHEGVRRGIVNLPLEPAAALARMSLAEGHISDALAFTEAPMAVVVSKAIWLWATDIAPVRVAALVAAGRVPEATQLVASFADGLGERDAPAPQAALQSCRSLLLEAAQDYVGAAVSWGATAGAWAALPQPYKALRARERQGLSMLSYGERAGLAHLTEVYSALMRLGAEPDAERVWTALRSNGAKSRPTWRGGRRGYGDQLSPRELEVVRLLVGGLTTPEIASALSRSSKTVAAQINSAMRKYGVTSRTALAVGATQAGITPAVSPAKP
ncbi:helix-turn-helix transcriptional regulator [Streptomyces sp. NPDC059215]|uniref:helix-turn-helix transcriptional regulator n=1 Tax=Streptomyces sp. NPDC059215 TaxID=3346772 RepID=UPI0036C5225C